MFGTPVNPRSEEQVGEGLSGKTKKWTDAVLSELHAHGGSSVVVVGDHQAPDVHLLAHSINRTLGNIGKTVFYTDSVDANPVNQTESLKDLLRT